MVSAPLRMLYPVLRIPTHSNLEESGAAWHVCRSGWCAGTDHMSCSLINAQIPALFTDGVGLVLSSSTHFECAYNADGGTQSKALGGCYDVGECRPDMWWNCAWPQTRLYDAVATQIRTNSRGYNEYIVSAQYWEGHMPGIIEAIMCVKRDCGQAREVHEGYLAEYGRTSSQTPLVYFDGDTFVRLDG